MQEGITAVATNARTDDPCDLYRFFDAADRLLYVGISKELPTRWRNHGMTKDWWPAVVRATIEHYESRREAEEAEILAIQSEGPIYNVNHVQESVVVAELVAEVASVELSDKGELTPAEAAASLSVSVATVRRWDKKGVLVPSRRLPGSRHRRYRRSEVEALRSLIADPAGMAKLMQPGQSIDARRPARARGEA